MNYKRIFLLFLLSSFTVYLHAQVVAGTDTSSNVEILPGVRKLELRKLPDGTEVQILAGNVRLRQGTTIFSTVFV